MSGRDDEQCALDRRALVQCAGTLGVTLSAEQTETFARFAVEIVAWNARVNLTRITDPEGIAVRHFADSLACLPALPPASEDAAVSVVDVGTGAGLPGVALKIVRPGLRLALVDSVGRKTAFLQHLVAVLGLDDVEVICARAEDLGRDACHRERYDVALARAVGALSVVAEYVLPLVAVGGHMLAHKGGRVDADDEIAAASRALALLGGRPLPVVRYALPGIDDARAIVAVEKCAPCPAGYPRRAGTPARRPL